MPSPMKNAPRTEEHEEQLEREDHPAHQTRETEMRGRKDLPSKFRSHEKGIKRQRLRAVNSHHLPSLHQSGETSSTVNTPPPTARRLGTCETGRVWVASQYLSQTRHTFIAMALQTLHGKSCQFLSWTAGAFEHVLCCSTGSDRCALLEEPEHPYPLELLDDSEFDEADCHPIVSTTRTVASGRPISTTTAATTVRHNPLQHHTRRHRTAFKSTSGINGNRLHQSAQRLVWLEATPTSHVQPSLQFRRCSSTATTASVSDTSSSFWTIPSSRTLDSEDESKIEDVRSLSSVTTAQRGSSGRQRQPQQHSLWYSTVAANTLRKVQSERPSSYRRYRHS